MADKICGECRYHKAEHHRVNDGTHFNDFTEWYCSNADSDYYTDFTAYSDTCDMFEQRGVE